jgi:hypothetical protein
MPIINWGHSVGHVFNVTFLSGFPTPLHLGDFVAIHGLQIFV